jgi:hypothetical protein
MFKKTLMKKTILQFAMMLSSFSLIAQNYSNGLFLMNEGNFGTTNGDVSFLDYDSNTLYEDVFQTENTDEEGFDVLQDFKLYNGEAFFLSKSAANEKLVIADASTFVLSNTIDLNAAGPQSITMISESKAYISCSNAPNLRILDLGGDSISGSVTSSIGGFSSQDYISLVGNMAYIFMGDKLGIIDTELDSAYSEILLPNAEVSCSGMLVLGTKLFVLTNSGWSDSFARLFRIDLESGSVEATINLSSLGKARLLQSDGAFLYFMVTNEVYKMGVDDDLSPTTSFTTSSYSDNWDLTYGKSFYINADAQEIYIGSAEGFAADGSYEVLSLSDGTELSSANASGGIGLSKFLVYGSPLSVASFDEYSVSIYPIPANEFLNISFTDNQERRIVLMDGNGRILNRIESGDQLVRMELSDLSAGMYFIQIESTSGLYTEKVLIY